MNCHDCTWGNAVVVFHCLLQFWTLSFFSWTNYPKCEGRDGFVPLPKALVWSQCNSLSPEFEPWPADPIFHIDIYYSTNTPILYEKELIILFIIIASVYSDLKSRICDNDLSTNIIQETIIFWRLLCLEDWNTEMTLYLPVYIFMIIVCNSRYFLTLKALIFSLLLSVKREFFRYIMKAYLYNITHTQHFNDP